MNFLIDAKLISLCHLKCFGLTAGRGKSAVSGGCGQGASCSDLSMELGSELVQWFKDSSPTEIQPQYEQVCLDNGK